MSEILTEVKDNEPKKNSTERPPRGKRLNSYWEPVYDPNDKEPFPECEWNFTHQPGARHSTCSAEGLWASSLGKKTFKFIKQNFSLCDFYGRFENRRVVFVECLFDGCDFGFSYWNAAKFTRCRFLQCSFSMATFEGSEFRDCVWENIYFTGNETKLFGTVITNPQQFIDAAHTSLDENLLRRKNTTPAHQKMKLEKSKAVVARSILKNLGDAGDEDSYYQAVKAYLNQSVRSKSEEAWYNINNEKISWKTILEAFKIFFLFIEGIILNATGAVNKWGSSIARPAVLGVLVIIIYAIIYQTLGIKPTILSSFVASIDVTLLVGYTKHVTKDDRLLHQVLFASNMLIGLLWYVVFIPTVINRISRVRQ